MKKLLIWAPAPWATTGYGRLAANFGTRLSKHFDLAYFSFTHIVGTDGIQFEGCPVFSSPHEWIEQPKHYVKEVAAFWKPDYILQFFDLFILMPVLRRYANTLPLVCYSPVDSIPISQRVWESAILCKKVVPQTKWAKDIYDKSGVDTQDAIYHGVDPAIYHPRTEEERRKIRQGYGIDSDVFLVLMVQANTQRKNIPSQIKAFQEFKRLTSADAHLIGVIPNIEVQRAYDLNMLWESMKQGQDDCFSHTYNLNEVQLSDLYSIADVLLQCTYGEGFGLPVIEAGACGVPTIATNFSSLPELLGGRDMVASRGWLVNGELNYFQPDGLNNWQMIPYQRDIVTSLIDAYEHKEKRKRLGEAMRAFVLAECNWDRLTEKMVKVLE